MGYLKTLIETLKSVRQRRLDILEKWRKTDHTREQDAYFQSLDNLVLTLSFSLESAIHELKDMAQKLQTLEYRLAILNKEVDKAENREGKKILEENLRKYYRHIIEATKRASMKKYGNPNMPVRPDEIVEQFRVLVPAPLAVESITRMIRKMAEYGYLVRVEKGLYRVGETNGNTR